MPASAPPISALIALVWPETGAVAFVRSVRSYSRSPGKASPQTFPLLSMEKIRLESRLRLSPPFRPALAAGSSDEYKAETVRLIQSSGKSIGKIALELGIGETASEIRFHRDGEGLFCGGVMCRCCKSRARAIMPGAVGGARPARSRIEAWP